MPPEPPKSPTESGLVIRPASGLVPLPNGRAPALSEIVGRALVHIRTNKALGALHRIGAHDLYGPDYRLICAWAEMKRIKPEEFLLRLLRTSPVKHPSFSPDCSTALVAGRFRRLWIDWDTFPGDGIPLIEGLVIECFCLWCGTENSDIPTKPTLYTPPDFQFFDGYGPENLDLSMFPSLKKLVYLGAPLTNLDLSVVPNLVELECSHSGVSRIDLSAVPNLKKLCWTADWRDDRKLKELDLTPVPNLLDLDYSGSRLSHLNLAPVSKLQKLNCSSNSLDALDLSQVPCLRILDCSYNKLGGLNLSDAPGLEELRCSYNPISGLDIRPLKKLRYFDFERHGGRILQRSDQNFK